jgi:cytochrome c
MKILIPAVAAVAALGLATGAQAAGDAGKGKAYFNQQCSLCHSANPGQEGAAPSLFGVIGRKAGGDPKFPSYTTALKSSGIVWSEEKIETFLSGPSKLVPGTAMPITVKAPADRENIAAYLATLKR